MAEFHAIGSPPLLEATLAALHGLGVRPARRGEFTLRAFLAGRIDLVQAEAVLGVIDAPDHRHLEVALRQLGGGISGRIASVRGDLLDLLADLEAGLDFADEGIDLIQSDALLMRLRSAREVLRALLESASHRMHVRARPRVVLAGLPNAGKSTLFNRLLDRPAALVSSQEGTTRDYLSAGCHVGGLNIELVDTAGWQAAAVGMVEQVQRLREEQFDRADLIVWCTAADATAESAAIEIMLIHQLVCLGRPLLRVETKSDLTAGEPDMHGMSVSALTGKGLAAFAKAIALRLSSAPDDSELTDRETSSLLSRSAMLSMRWEELLAPSTPMTCSTASSASSASASDAAA
jgi:tRNA modification GTPase